MTSEQERTRTMVPYEKPTAIDLGPTAPVVGASCAEGSSYAPGSNCDSMGNGAAFDCGAVGMDAGLSCSATGNSAGFECSEGGSGDH